jgi:hypothetical protein
MKIGLVVTALLLPLAACGSESGDVAKDPAGRTSPPTAGHSAPAAPVPAGLVRTLNLATVMDRGTAELCLGPIAESYPPQCGGPEITNWDWSEHGHRMFEQQGDIRWGTYLVTGRWDGTSFKVTETIPGPLYDPAASEPTPTPTPATSYTNEELERIAHDLTQLLPGVQGAYGGEGTSGHVLADVLYDDGSLQAWADEHYGVGVVLISSALVDVDG